MLAIIIPYFNIRFFQETLDSLVNQTNKNFKVYIFNDNSPENPLNLLDNYRDCLDIEYKKFNKNYGSNSLVKHWHRCLENIHEEWFSILGDDDCVPINYTASFYENLDIISTQKINIVRYATLSINDYNTAISTIYLHPEIEHSIDSLVRKILGKTRSSLSEFIYKNCPDNKKYFVDFPNAFYSDDLSFLLASNFQNIFTINNAVVKIRRGNFNLSGKNTNLKKANLAEFLFYKYLLSYYSNKFNLTQKKLFLHKLNRVIIRTKSLKMLCFVVVNQLKIIDINGLFYLPRIASKKLINMLRKL